MTSESRAQRLVDEFEEAAHFAEGYDVRANCSPTDAIRYARAVLDRWGRQ